MKTIECLRTARNQYWQIVGEKRWTRILMIACVLTILWCFFEWLAIGYLLPNYWHDVLCLGMAITFERLLPWGKTVPTPKEKETIYVLEPMEKKKHPTT